MRSLKRILTSIGLGLGLAIQSNAQDVGGGGNNFYSASFLNGYNLVVSNNITVTSGTSTNLPYTSWRGQDVFSLSNQFVIYTNTANGNITNTIQVPDFWTDVRGFTDKNGNCCSNACIVIALNSTNAFFPPGQNSLPNPNNPNNQTNWVPVITLTSASTNTMTFTFVRSGDPQANQYPITTPGGVAPNTFGTTALDQFQVVIGAGGTSASVICTNIPPNFLTGTKWIRLSSVASSSAATSPGVIVNVIKLGTWGNP